MNHGEAVKEMAAERYLLDELAPDARDAFEEHLFDCPECTLDVRSGSMFVDSAKAELSGAGLGSAAASKTKMPREEKLEWFSWLRPVWAVPALASLLVVVGYQNFVTLPALRNSANQPHIVKVAPLYGATRGGSRVIITADRVNGIALPVELPVDSTFGSYTSFAFELSNPQGKSVWTSSVPAPAQDANDLQFSIVIPGGLLEDGTYTLTVSGVGAGGEKTETGRYVFGVSLSK